VRGEFREGVNRDGARLFLRSMSATVATGTMLLALRTGLLAVFTYRLAQETKASLVVSRDALESEGAHVLLMRSIIRMVLCRTSQLFREIRASFTS
jgi:hypothetical protein